MTQKREHAETRTTVHTCTSKIDVGSPSRDYGVYNMRASSKQLIRKRRKGIGPNVHRKVWIG